jgi:4-amino-4-deoxy-L-arabinose transferase-like glycosyltransferase
MSVVEHVESLNEPIEVTPPPPAPSRFRRFLTHPLTLVSLLTIAGGGLRFMYLSQPPLWGDEAKTYMRVCGTLQQLIDALYITDFTPLHYLLLWTIGQFTPLTPFMMRLAPAICGTLMIPAMYLLAVQILSRPAALLATAFTAFSAYLLNYSRDAKMYAECWFFVTLSMALLLVWIRTRSRFAWYGWVICSVTMLGLHAVSIIAVPVQTIIFLSHRRIHWKSAIFFVLGVAITVAPTLVHKQYFERQSAATEEDRLVEGISWVEPYNAGRDGLDLFRYAGTSFLYSWEWPQAVDEPQIRERTLKLLHGAGIGLALLLALGLFPWRSFRERTEQEISSIAASPAESWWRELLWLGTWSIVPAYGFYRASLHDAIAPWMWWPMLRDAAAAHPYAFGSLGIISLAAFWFCARTWKRRLLKTALLVSVSAVLIGLCWLVYEYVPVQRGSVWIPRYLGSTWPAFAMAVAVLLMRLPTAALRTTAIALLLGVNLIQHGARVFAGSEPPIDRIIADAIEATTPDSHTRTFAKVTVRSPMVGEPGMGAQGTHPARYYIVLGTGKPITPAEFRTARWDDANFRIPRPEEISQQALKNDPRVQRIVVWDELQVGQVEMNDPLAAKLAPEFDRTTEQRFAARDHWTWRDLYVVRLRVYERLRG